MNKRTRTGFLLATSLAALVATGITLVARARSQQSAPGATEPQGQSATLLSDGRWLLLGGDGPAGVAARGAIVDPATGTTAAIAEPMVTARAWHTATVLADGRVLIVGGRRDGGVVDVPEVFDPAAGTFTPLAIAGSVARAQHSATLLTDGRVLIAGGTNGGTVSIATEIWEVEAQTATATPFDGISRAGHSATLLADGRVMISGGQALDDSTRAQVVDLIDPKTSTVVRAQGVPEISVAAAPVLAESTPTSGASGVPLDTHVALRFSRPAALATVNTQTVQLTGPQGAIPVRVVVAEQGALAFLWPAQPLAEDTTYNVSIAGVMDMRGVPFIAPGFAFTTATRPSENLGSPEREEWAPDATSRENGWRTGRAPSPWESQPPLMAPPGVTAISGRVLTLDGKPLPDVSLSVEGDAETHSDRTGRFLLVLRNTATARRVLRIDGKPASHPSRRYGFYEYGLTINAGMTNVLPFTIWQPKLDLAHQVAIPSPTTSEIVVTTPSIPGLELHLPPGTAIVGEDGKPVTTLGITAIPVDRPPFPLAKNVEVPVYFTIQPGGAYVRTAGAGPQGAWLVYPNYRHEYAGKRMQFYHYDPDVKDWYVYGLGTVLANETQVVPDPRTRLYTFTGAMINGGGNPGGPGRPPGDCCNNDGDPVNLPTGVFVDETTDLYVPDVLPLALTRTYRSQDQEARPFGYGMTHPYAMFLWSAQQYTQADLILPDGGRVHYIRTSAGVSWTDAVFHHQEHVDPDPQLSTSATPTAFYQSVMRWNGNGWDVVLQDGTVYVFGENAPLQAIRDRYGNQVTIVHSNGQAGTITRVVSPSGRWLAFNYTNGLVSQVVDNIGRTVTYDYDGTGHLITVTQANDTGNVVTRYTYDSGHRMLTKQPPSLQGTQTYLVTNEYTTSADAPTPVGWVKKQTHVDGGVYQFAYTFQNGKIYQTVVTDPRGTQRRVTFNTDAYTVADERALGQPEQQGDTRDRPSRTNFVTSSTNSHGDVTTTDYDALGRVTRVVRLPGTADEAITTYTYDPVWTSEIATMTDPLSHVTTFEYDERGNRKSVIDALNHKTSFIYNTAGQVTSVTDPLQHTTTYEYRGPDVVAITDPLLRVTRRFFDGAGRMLAQTDAAGHTSRFAYDKVNHLTQATDPLNGVTSYGYDTPGRLQSVTDALTHATTYSYDQFDRLVSRTDPLGKGESFTYDLDGNPSQRTDRKGQVTTRTYDALNRLHQLTYDDTSTITYTYDDGNRLRVIDDSLNGEITRDYDALDRLTSETTPQGTISYTYDKADRRATMTVTGQPTVTYGYDDANLLTSITQGTSTVTITYDDANRRSTLTLPNGIVTTYGYDEASQLTSLTYALGQTTLGTLTYMYDLNGRRTEVGGTWARTGLPQTVASTSYDAANRLTQRGGATFSYDANGNLASDGLTSYIWSARDELAGLNGEVLAAFEYDGLGRLRSRSGAQSISFLYDRNNVVQELSAGVPTANRLTAGIDEVFQRAEASGTAILLADALGSTIALANSTGLVQAGYTYSPFGETTTTGASNSNFTQYTGREYDGTTGLYYYRARYYLPSHGRFASEDPLKPNDGWSLYVYGDDAPIDNSDPSGLFTITRQRASNTVVCDGKGGLIIQLLGITSPCLIDCTRRHELSHVIDIRSRNPSICAGQAQGTGIAPSDDAERKWTEIRASQEEINCLKRKLKENCEGKCRATIEARIKQMEQFRDSFK